MTKTPAPEAEPQPAPDNPEPQPDPRPLPSHVIAALARVAEELPGIGKDAQASAAQGGYSYRSIEAITAAAQHLLGKYGVVFVPKVTHRETIQLQVGGKPWTEEQLTIEYTVYGPGGVEDQITVGPLIALGRDNVDKGTNKCQPAGTMVRVPVHMPGRGTKPRLGWTEVPIETLRAGDKVVTWRRLRSSLVPAGRLVEGVAARPYSGPLLTITAGGASTSVTPDHRCVVRLGPLAEGNHVVYMMRRGDQHRVGRCLWAGAMQAGRRTPRRGPIWRAWQEDADAVWVLSVHATVEYAALAEALTAARFGVPDVAFRHQAGYAMPLDQFWSKVGDNSRQAEDCLRSFGLLPNAPLFRRPTAGATSWLPEDGTAAANLRSGMRVPVPAAPRVDHQGWQRFPVAWEPLSVRRSYYDGLVYSMDVAREHTYVADGIVTHNCMTQAFKYALLQVLCIGDNKDDADSGGAPADAPTMTPDQWAEANGWANLAEHDEARKALHAGMANAPSAAIRTALGKWYKDQTDAPAWAAAWPKPWFEVVRTRLHELVGAHMAGSEGGEPGDPEPAEAPQAAQEPQPAPTTPEPPPEAETPAVDPPSAPTAPEGDPMPWDGLDDQAPGADPDPRQLVVDWVNAVPPRDLPAVCRVHDVDGTGTAKAVRARLAKALVAKGWTPDPA